MYGNSVFSQGSGSSRSSYSSSSNSMDNFQTSSSSFGFNSSAAAATTNPFSSYSRSYSPNSDCMLYYKDKPMQKQGRALKFIQKLLQEPWMIVGLLLLAGVVAGCNQRATKAWLLREFHAQSFTEAVDIWHEIREDHLELAQEFEELYSAQTKWEQRDFAWRQHVQRLHNFTQRESRRAVLDKFGPGPHHVSIKVLLPNDNPSPLVVNPDTQLLETPKYDPQSVRAFQIELAPLSEMPHAVHMFLEQVSHGLWNRMSSFYVNQEHVMQAGPRTRAARQLFTDYNLEKLAFPEYSHAFPHKQWTLGYAGRPGGPSFYINKINNMEDHGPFGQEHHALDEFADSCFAKIVSGFDTLQEMIRQTDAQHHTQIVGMEIINWDDHWTDGNDAHWKKAHQMFDDVSQDSTDDIVLQGNQYQNPSQQRPEVDGILHQAAPKHVEPAYHHTLGHIQQHFEQQGESHHQPHYHHHAARHLEGYHATHLPHHQNPRQHQTHH